MNEADLTGYCGLYCGDCIRYRSRASALAKELLEELEQTQFSEYAKVKQLQMQDFRYYEPMIKLLAHISQLRCEVPCRIGGGGCIGACQIIACAQGKSYEGCWECAEPTKCEKLDFLKPFHGDAPLQNLSQIKEFGLKAWARHRGKFYPWLTK